MNPTPISIDLLRGMALPQPEAGSKDQRGRVLVVAGSLEVPGAALLAGTAALRAGAGKLKMATGRTVAPHLGLAVPEALVIGLLETPQGGFDVAAEERLCEAAGASDAVLIGPGMTSEDSTAELTQALLMASSSCAFVLDAAALDGLPERAAAVKSRDGRVVITPHAGEMAGLLDRSREDIEAAPLEAAREAAQRLNAVVVMKGAKSFIVDPQGKAWSYDGGGVGLATSGSGDVLAGIIVGLLARGAEPAQAACWGVFLHGEAGTRLARSQGPLGFLARDIPGEVPMLLRDAEAAGGP